MWLLDSAADGVVTEESGRLSKLKNNLFEKSFLLSDGVHFSESCQIDCEVLLVS